MNKQYRKGIRKEYKVRDELNAEGFIAQRSAGSHSFFDVVGISKEKKEIIFVQCKAGEFRDSEKRKLEEEYAWINDNFKVKFVLN